MKKSVLFKQANKRARGRGNVTNTKQTPTIHRILINHEQHNYAFTNIEKMFLAAMMRFPTQENKETRPIKAELGHK